MSKKDLTRSARLKSTKGARIGQRAPIIVGSRSGSYLEFGGYHLVLVHEIQHHPDVKGDTRPEERRLWKTTIAEIKVASREDAHELLKVLQ